MTKAEGKKTLFLDRDGVVNVAPEIADGRAGSPKNIGEFILTENVVDFSHLAVGMGYQIIIFTNQPEVARGNFKVDDMLEIEAYCRCELPIVDYFACFHDDADGCDCRKPKPGMLTMAAEKWNINLADSVVIGDRDKDVKAGAAVGAFSILLENKFYNRNNCTADAYVTDITASARYLRENSRED
ncbi:HAD-IIIA family hydrolase [Alphaproteobacteria bacterium]|nr:HAD-IIIA family hydrolase [Alphaproteobacteria bacterium]